MAKRDKRLYRTLRTAGVRKGVARTAAQAARVKGEGGQRTLDAIAQELHGAADVLEARSHTAGPEDALREAARRTAAEKV